MRVTTLTTGIAAALLLTGCSDHTRAEGHATARSAKKDIGKAVADLKRDTAPLRRDVTHAADKAEVGAKHIVAKANAAIAKSRR